MTNFGTPGPPVAIGSEFYIDLFSELFTPGFVDIYQTSDNTVVGSGAISAVGNGFEILFSSVDIGGAGSFNFAATVGDPFGAASDRVPNGADPLSSVQAVPEPSTMVAWMLLAGVAGPVCRRRKKRAA